MASHSRLDSTLHHGAWASQDEELGQWIHAELEEVKVILKIATQGRAESGYNQFVTSYKLATSTGGDLEYILDEFGHERLFPSNLDQHTVVENCVGNIQAFRVRLYPQTWYAHISLRWEVYSLREPGDKNIYDFLKL